MRTYSNVLVAYDGSDLSQDALEQGNRLVKDHEQGHLHVIAVWSQPILEAVDYGAYDIYEEMSKAHENHVQGKIDEAKAATEELGKHRTFTVTEGHPARQIVKYSKEHNIDLVVIGSRGLSGIKKLFLGSVSNYVVQESPCAVLVIK